MNARPTLPWSSRIVLACFLAAFVAERCVAADSPELANLLKTAASATGQERYAAIDRLGVGSEAPDRVVPQLTTLLQDDDPQVRWRSARALGDYGQPARNSADDLRKLASDDDPIVQYHATVALGKTGDRSDETIRVLVAAATSQDTRVARAAIAAIRNLEPGPQRVAAVLGEVLKSDDPAVQLHALETITRLGADAVPLLKEALQRPETTYLACAAIEQIGPDARATVPELSSLLRETRHSQLLIQALLALASIGRAAQPAESSIVPLLDVQEDETVPVAAAYALGAIGAKNADGPLRQALSNDNAFLQMVAAWALARTHPDDQTLMQQAVDKLAAGLGSSEPQMRMAAANGLQKLQPPPEMVAPVLMKVANDPDPDVSANAVSALAGLGEAVVPRAVNALQKPEYRDFAVRVLTELGPKASAAVGPLTVAMSNADQHFRIEAQLALAAIGPAAAPATDELAQSIDSDDQGVRESALFALREIGPGARAAVEPLAEKLEADDSFDAMAAAWALARIAPNDAAVAAKAVPKLITGLSSDDEQVRLEAIDALAAFGPAARPAVDALQRAARDDNSPTVRAAAEAALHEIATN